MKLHLEDGWVLVAGKTGHPLLVLLGQNWVLRWDDATRSRIVDGQNDDRAIDGTAGLACVLGGDRVSLGNKRLAETTDLRSSKRSNERKSRKD